MADITVTAAEVAVVFPDWAEIYNVIAAEAITAGQALYQKTDGTYALADASFENSAQVRGIALEPASVGEGLSMLKEGIIAGFSLATYDDPVYLSDTAGALSTTAGTVLVRVGRVMGLADRDLTEVLYVEADWLRRWYA
jgi:hypothetical protein